MPAAAVKIEQSAVYYKNKIFQSLCYANQTNMKSIRLQKEMHENQNYNLEEKKSPKKTAVHYEVNFPVQ